MSGFLLDTHTLLWWMSDEHDRLGPDALLRPRAGDERVLVSAASIWETAIKRAVGKLDAPPGLLDHVVAAGLEVLAITGRHAEAAGSLPLHHRDPFDRCLVAQAQVEKLALLTGDAHLGTYGVDIVW